MNGADVSLLNDRLAAVQADAARLRMSEDEATQRDATRLANHVAELTALLREAAPELGEMAMRSFADDVRVVRLHRSRGGRREWSRGEREELRRLFEGGERLSDAEIGERMGRSAGAIEGMRARLGLRRPDRKVVVAMRVQQYHGAYRAWTPVEDATLVRLFAAGEEDAPIGAAIRRTERSVQRRRQELGLLREHAAGSGGYRPNLDTLPAAQAFIASADAGAGRWPLADQARLARLMRTGGSLAAAAKAMGRGILETKREWHAIKGDPAFAPRGEPEVAYGGD